MPGRQRLSSAKHRACAKEAQVIRGRVVWVDLSDATPPEMGKKRPAVIVSCSVHNQSLNSVVVVRLSSRAPEILPLRVRLMVEGLTAVSFAVVPGIRQVKKSRILATAGRLAEGSAEAGLVSLDEAIREYLSD
jgi:mRNA-degrading endonuclease toxin of MazEF toxin-antitoxin module